MKNQNHDGFTPTDSRRKKVSEAHEQTRRAQSIISGLRFKDKIIGDESAIRTCQGHLMAAFLNLLSIPIKKSVRHFRKNHRTPAQLIKLVEEADMTNICNIMGKARRKRLDLLAPPIVTEYWGYMPSALRNEEAWDQIALGVNKK